MHTRFELAPTSRRQDWEKAFAFAFAIGAPAYFSLYLLSDRSLPIALIAGSVCFVGVFIVALAVSTTSPGHLALLDDAVQLDSGHLHLRVPLAELDLAAARLGDDADASPRLITRAAHAVTIPRHSGPALVVTPLDSAAFIQTLRQHRK